MLTFTEAPLHSGLLILLCVLALLLTLMGIYWMVKSEKKSRRAFSYFLTSLFAFFTFLIQTIMVYQLPATSTADQLLPYYLGAWTAVSMYGFFLVYYCLDFEFFKERRWLMYLPFVGTISFITVLWVFTTPSSTIVVSDGIMNWLAMPFVVYAYGGFLAIFYFFLVPLYTTYKVTQDPQVTWKIWSWLAMLGVFFWFIAALMMALVLYLAPYMLIALGLAAIAWLIELIAWIGISRASP